MGQEVRRSHHDHTTWGSQDEQKRGYPHAAFGQSRSMPHHMRKPRPAAFDHTWGRNFITWIGLVLRDRILLQTISFQIPSTRGLVAGHSLPLHLRKPLPFPNLPMLIYKMQLHKVTIKILLFYLIKNKSHFEGKCVLWTPLLSTVVSHEEKSGRLLGVLYQF